MIKNVLREDIEKIIADYCVSISGLNKKEPGASCACPGPKFATTV
jgi:hypothetical protein